MSNINKKSIIASLQRTVKNSTNQSVSGELVETVINKVCGSIDQYSDDQRPIIVKALISEVSAITVNTGANNESLATTNTDTNDSAVNTESNIPTGTLSIPAKNQLATTNPGVSSQIDRSVIAEPSQTASYGAPNKETIIQDAVAKAQALEDSLDRLAQFEVAVSNQAITQALQNAAVKRNAALTEQDQLITSSIETFWGQNREFFRNSTNQLQNLFTSDSEVKG
jgi:hypothetical protein